MYIQGGGGLAEGSDSETLSWFDGTHNIGAQGPIDGFLYSPVATVLHYGVHELVHASYRNNPSPFLLLCLQATKYYYY